MPTLSLPLKGAQGINIMGWSLGFYWLMKFVPETLANERNLRDRVSYSCRFPQTDLTFGSFWETEK